MNIFVSYSWENNTFVNKLDVLFKNIGIILRRDVRDVKYKQSINNYIETIRDADFCLMIISDQYLKSKNCMYEVLEFIKDKNYKDKILPIIYEDVKIYDAKDRLSYIEFWQNEYDKINKLRSAIDTLAQVDVIQELKIVENIKINISDFLSSISDLQLITIDKEITLKQFNEIIDYVNPKSEIFEKSPNERAYLVVNIPGSIRENVFKWWQYKSAGYINDIREAKVFLEDEAEDFFSKSDCPEWENKKYTAIPIDVIIDLNINVIPFNNEYVEKIRNNIGLIGNKLLFIKSDEVDNYF